MAPLSIYLHIPFCTTKCTYCAFNTYTHLETLIPAFVDAMTREVEFLASGLEAKAEVGTIFFGGGTPTLLTAEQLGQIIESINRGFKVLPDAEITAEANPNDLELDYLKALRSKGINRLSIGMQSSNPQELRLFARRHDYETVIRVVPLARVAGFDNLNLDLIYGIPEQTLETWRETLDAALQLTPEHISLYALGLEDGTPLKAWVEQGRVPSPDDDLTADMYDLATELLADAGYEQYEISNWSKPGCESQHNLQYWKNLPYAGLGPGGHGYAGGVRYATVLSPQRYIKVIQDAVASGHRYDFPYTPATTDAVVVDQKSEIAETLIMGLRLVKAGIHRAQFLERFNVDVVDLHRETLEKYARYGLLQITDERVHLTQQGRLLSNTIFRELV
jgi:oxygen-independent coproporphyrinogen III oxidase